MHVELIAVTQYLRGSSTSEELLEHAGRVCYRSTKRGEPGRFLTNRIREGHESIIEHANLTFEVSGISRSCSHQLVRHRIASYSQESQRYVDMSSPEWVIPPSVAENRHALKLWEETISTLKNAYRSLRKIGIPKEDARYLLPNATQTRIILTMNFRTLRHLFKLRISRHAQWEIRDVSLEMLRLATEVAPDIFGDIWADVQTDHPEWLADL